MPTIDGPQSITRPVIDPEKAPEEAIALESRAKGVARGQAYRRRLSEEEQPVAAGQMELRRMTDPFIPGGRGQRVVSKAGDGTDRTGVLAREGRSARAAASLPGTASADTRANAPALSGSPCSGAELAQRQGTLASDKPGGWQAGISAGVGGSAAGADMDTISQTPRASGGSSPHDPGAPQPARVLTDHALFLSAMGSHSATFNARQAKPERSRNIPAAAATAAGRSGDTAAAGRKHGVEYVFSSWGNSHSVNVLPVAGREAGVKLTPSNQVVEAALVRGGGQGEWLVQPAQAPGEDEARQGHSRDRWAGEDR